MNELDSFVASKPTFVPRPYRCKACQFFQTRGGLEQIILESEALKENRFSYIAQFANSKGANLNRHNIRTHFGLKHSKETA